jgi:hypothetical protein
VSTPARCRPTYRTFAGDFLTAAGAWAIGRLNVALTHSNNDSSTRRPPDGENAMTLLKIAQDRAFDIADAENVLAQTKRYLPKMQPLGVTQARVRAYEDTLVEARRLERSTGRVSLDDARKDLKDKFGHYRKRADLVANGFDGPNEKLSRTLLSAGQFPRNDAELAKAASGIAAVLEEHGALLSGVGFGKTSQEALAKAASHFLVERTTKPTKVGQRQAEATARDRAFEALRYQTSYFRRVGLAALEGETAASGFHRVKAGAKGKKGGKAPVVAGAKASA